MTCTAYWRTVDAGVPGSSLRPQPGRSSSTHWKSGSSRISGSQVEAAFGPPWMKRSVGPWPYVSKRTRVLRLGRRINCSVGSSPTQLIQRRCSAARYLSILRAIRFPLSCGGVTRIFSYDYRVRPAIFHRSKVANPRNNMALTQPIKGHGLAVPRWPAQTARTARRPHRPGRAAHLRARPTCSQSRGSSPRSA